MTGRGGKTAQKKRTSKSAKAGLVMPVSRFIRALKKGNYSKRLSAASGVYAAAVIEYLVAEVLELAGKASTDNKKRRISPRHIQLAIRNDEELNRFCEGVVISQGGVMPNVHPALLKQRKDWKSSDTAILSQEQKQSLLESQSEKVKEKSDGKVKKSHKKSPKKTRTSSE
ncbi:putative Histone H2A [Hypsibius exemplaris]|uniref:Histone H2A n=1 Tax=Hypsibius exemplaris TaxID=2072580 RepID=A0A1W0WK89_HYPEX|nr:putative Histone H2A [Hypsibius exemplaris]